MAQDFSTMTLRIAAELRRSNINDAIRAAINDAVEEESKTRFYFNEMRGITFNTVIGQEYYPDQGLVEIDSLYYTQGGTRYNLFKDGNALADARADGNNISGQLESYSRQGVSLRLYPIPAAVVPVYADGYGKLTPFPFVLDEDTSAWLSTGERLIRARAKAIVMKEVIRDYGEATVLEAMADDIHAQFTMETTIRLGTGQLEPTQW